MSASTAPAIGAWTIGSSMPKRSRMRRSGHMSGHITAPTCQGTNSLSPRPSASLLVFSPEATREHALEDLAALGLDRDAVADDVAAVDVHVVGHLREEPVVGRDLDRRRGLGAEGRAAAGGEDHDLGAAGDLAGRRHRVVAGGVHEDEAGLGDGLGVLIDRGQRRGAALGGGAERFLEDRGQAACLVAGRGVVVHRAAVERGVVLPPADALDQLLGDLRRWRRGAAAAARRRRSPASRRGSRCRPCRRAGRRRRRARGWR